MNEIRVGDVVWLNSGGPAMTVVTIYGEGDDRRADCSWVAEDGRTMSHTFPVVCLRNDEAPERKN